MHEFSIAVQIVEQVGQIVKRHGSQKATKVVLSIGEASGIEPVALQTALQSVKTNSCMEHATVVLQPVKATIQCSQCQSVSPIEKEMDIYGLCPHCQGFTTIVEGREMTIKSIDVE